MTSTKGKLRVGSHKYSLMSLSFPIASILNRDDPSPDSCIHLMKFIDNAINKDCVELYVCHLCLCLVCLFVGPQLRRLSCQGADPSGH